MSTKPRTIDNLGTDASNRYAVDQKLVDKELLQGSRQVGGLSEVSVTTPYIPSGFDEQFNTFQKNLPWARFAPPPKYLSHRKRIFTFQLVPSLGSTEKHEQELQKLSKDKEEKHKEHQFEGFEKDEEEKERKKVIKLLKMLGLYDQYLSLINARRGQYHKG
ncbi:MAG: DUF5399 family protein [Chlamydiota bacterium]|jgi:hypothetical protein